VGGTMAEVAISRRRKACVSAEAAAVAEAVLTAAATRSWELPSDRVARGRGWPRRFGCSTPRAARAKPEARPMTAPRARGRCPRASRSTLDGLRLDSSRRRGVSDCFHRAAARRSGCAWERAPVDIAARVSSAPRRRRAAPGERYYWIERSSAPPVAARHSDRWPHLPEPVLTRPLSPRCCCR